MKFVIENGVLIKCEMLMFAATVTLPAEVRVIGKRAFADETFLKRIYLQAPVTAIEDEAFQGCTHLKTIAPVSMKKHKGANFPEGLLSVGESAFQFCSSLRAVTLPSTVQALGDKAFFGCTTLRELTLPDTVKLMGEGILYHVRSGAFKEKNYSAGSIMVNVSVAPLMLHIRRTDGKIFDFPVTFPIPGLNLIHIAVLELLLYKRFDLAMEKSQRVHYICQMLKNGYLTEGYLADHIEAFLNEVIYDDNREALQFLTESDRLFQSIPAELYEKIILYANELGNYEIQSFLSDKMYRFTGGGFAGRFQL